MKRVVMSFAAIAVVSTVVSAGPSFEITPMVSKKIYNDDRPRFDDSEVLYGVRGNAYITENISAQVGFEASTDNGIMTDLQNPSIPGKTDLQRYSLNAQYDIPTGTKVTPYIFAGGGYEKIAHEYKPENIESQSFIDGGGGLRYAVNDSVDIVTEVKGIHKTQDKDDDILAGVGVGFKFGGSSSAVSRPFQSQKKAMTMAELAQLARANEMRNTQIKSSAPRIVSSTPTHVVQIPQQQVVVSQPMIEENGIPMAKTYPVSAGEEVVYDESSSYVSEGEIVYDDGTSTSSYASENQLSYSDIPSSEGEEVSSEIVYDKDDTVDICNVVGGGTPYVDAEYLDSQEFSNSSNIVDDIPSDIVKSSALSGYFIQVVALSKNSPSRIVSKLRSKGYPVVLKKTSRLTRVLVGPYSSRSVASKTLLKIKRIQGDAFIYRKK